MAELLSIIVGFAVVAAAARGLSRLERLASYLCFLAHVVLAWFQVWLHTAYYGANVSDMESYFEEGRAIARFLEFDFFRFAPEAAKLALHLDTRLPAIVIGEGSSTGTMAATAGFIEYLVGPSQVAACIVVGAFATIGQALAYRAARPSLTERDRAYALVGFLFVPSVVFWSSAYSKEALALGFLGILCFATRHLSDGKRALGFVGVTIGAIGVAVLKPYILFPFVIAAMTWYYVSRARTRPLHVSAIYFVLAVALATAGIVGMGMLFPEYAVGHLSEQAAMEQGLGQAVGGGSFTQIGDANARSFSQQLPFVPIALFTSLFRPLFFEVKNAPMAAAALESTLLIVAAAILVIRYRWRHVITALRRSPLLAFCAVFVLSFSAAVGLASTNLGTLSRYRMPMMPFYVALILLLPRELSTAKARP